MPRLHFWKGDPYLPLWARWQRFKTSVEMRRIMHEDESAQELITRKNLKKESTEDTDEDTGNDRKNEENL